MKKYKVTFTKEYEYTEEYLKIIFNDSVKSFEEQAAVVATRDLHKEVSEDEFETNSFNKIVEVHDDLSELLNTPISNNISRRAKDSLKAFNITTLGQLAQMESIAFLLRVNVGEKTFKEIENILHSHNLKFKNEK